MTKKLIFVLTAVCAFQFAPVVAGEGQEQEQHWYDSIDFFDALHLSFGLGWNGAKFMFTWNIGGSLGGAADSMTQFCCKQFASDSVQETIPQDNLPAQALKAAIPIFAGHRVRVLLGGGQKGESFWDPSDWFVDGATTFMAASLTTVLKQRYGETVMDSLEEYQAWKIANSCFEGGCNLLAYLSPGFAGKVGEDLNLRRVVGEKIVPMAATAVGTYGLKWIYYNLLGEGDGD